MTRDELADNIGAFIAGIAEGATNAEATRAILVSVDEYLASKPTPPDGEPCGAVGSFAPPKAETAPNNDGLVMCECECCGRMHYQLSPHSAKAKLAATEAKLRDCQIEIGKLQRQISEMAKLHNAMLAPTHPPGLASSGGKEDGVTITQERLDQLLRYEAHILKMHRAIEEVEGRHLAAAHLPPEGRADE